MILTLPTPYGPIAVLKHGPTRVRVHIPPGLDGPEAKVFAIYVRTDANATRLQAAIVDVLKSTVRVTEEWFRIVPVLLLLGFKRGL